MFDWLSCLLTECVGVVGVGIAGVCAQVNSGPNGSCKAQQY